MLSDMTSAPASPFFDANDISQMSIEELEQHVLRIRARREAVVARIEAARSVSRNNKEGAIAFRLEKQIATAQKNVERADALIDKLEVDVAKIRKTLIEMGESNV